MSASSETQGQLVRAGKSLNRRGKNLGEEKSRTRIFLFFSRLFRIFPAPTNCPWVSEDGYACLLVICCTVYEHRSIKRGRWDFRFCAFEQLLVRFFGIHNQKLQFFGSDVLFGLRVFSSFSQQ